VTTPAAGQLGRRAWAPFRIRAGATARPASSAAGRRGPRGNPLLGSLQEYRSDLLGFLERCATDYGDLVPVRVALHRGFLINSPDLINDVVVRRHHDYRKVFPLRNNRLFLGDGLLTSEGEEWRSDRRLVQPAFHPDRVAGYAGIVVEEAVRTAGEWRDGEVREMQREMAELTLRSVVRCLFDSEASLDYNRVGWALDVIQTRMQERYKALVPLPDSAWTPHNIRLRHALRELDEIVYGLIRERRRSGADRPDLLSMLVRARYDNGAALPDNRVRDQIMTMLFAGHETSALVLSWSLYLLSSDPVVQAGLHQELGEVLGDRLPAAADLPRLGAVRRVVMEAMRLYPPVYAFGRDAVRDTDIGGHRIPAGASAIIAPWVLHRDGRFYSDPTEFRPQRWTEDFERNLPRHAYCPFGGGARMCMGKGFAMMETTLALATLVQRYRVRLVADHPIELWPTFTLRSRHGLPMTAHRWPVAPEPRPEPGTSAGAARPRGGQCGIGR
jgi:cytochrome P450